MSESFPNGETVTLLTAVPGKDAEGNDKPTFTSTPIAGCVVYPRGSTEQTVGQDIVTDDLTVLLPTGTVVKPTDRMVVRGDTYEIDAAAFSWVSPFTGWAPGVEVNLKKVTG